MSSLTQYQLDILNKLYDVDNHNTRDDLYSAVCENYAESKISKNKVSDFIREKKKNHVQFVEHVPQHDTVTKENNNDKKHVYVPSTGFYLDNRLDNFETSRLIDISKLVDALYHVHKIQKKSKDPDDKRPQGLLDLITEQKGNELMSLLFNVTLASVNAILSNNTMRNDLMNALEITELQNNVALLNKHAFGDDEEQEEAKLEYELQHNDSETSSDDSESENEEETEDIEKEKPEKLKHHLINVAPSIKVRSDEVDELRKGKVFV